MIAGPSATALIAAEWLLLSVVLLLILARLYLRLKITRLRLAYSDWCLILAFFSAVAATAFDIALLKLGVLRPEVDVTLAAVDDPAVRQKVIQYEWTSTFPLYLTFYLCKASVLGFYLQIFPPHVWSHLVLLYAVIVYSVVGFIVSICVTLFLCFPVQRFWSLGPDACPLSNISTTLRVPWAFHFSSDIFIFILPFLILHKLQMRRLAKIGVYCTFGLGVINLIFCLTRLLMIELQGSSGATPITLLDLWVNLDMSISLIIACLPSLRPYIGIISRSPYVSSLRNKSHRINPDNSGPNAASNGFSRIEDAPFQSHHEIRTEESVRSGGSRVELTWEEAKAQFHEAPRPSHDEGGSEIELTPVR